MCKMTLTFHADDQQDRREILMQIHSSDFYSALMEALECINNRVEYGTISESEGEFLSELRDILAVNLLDE